MNDSYLTNKVTIRLSDSQRRDIQKIIHKDQDAYPSRSSFVRGAVSRLIRSERVRLKL